MATEPAAAAPPTKSRRGMFIFVILAVIAIGAGAGIPWLFGGYFSELFAHQKKTEAPKSRLTALPFDDVVVNLGEEKLNRYLRVKLMVACEEADSRDMTELLTRQKAFLKSWLICYLSDQSSQEATRRAGVNRIRREICDQFNLMLYPNAEGKVVDILFDMFVVQQ